MEGGTHELSGEGEAVLVAVTSVRRPEAVKAAGVLREDAAAVGVHGDAVGLAHAAHHSKALAAAAHAHLVPAAHLARETQLPALRSPSAANNAIDTPRCSRYIASV